MLGKRFDVIKKGSLNQDSQADRETLCLWAVRWPISICPEEAFTTSFLWIISLSTTTVWHSHWVHINSSYPNPPSKKLFLGPWWSNWLPKISLSTPRYCKAWGREWGNRYLRHWFLKIDPGSHIQLQWKENYKRLGKNHYHWLCTIYELCKCHFNTRQTRRRMKLLSLTISTDFFLLSSFVMFTEKKERRGKNCFTPSTREAAQNTLLLPAVTAKQLAFFWLGGTTLKDCNVISNVIKQPIFHMRTKDRERLWEENSQQHSESGVYSMQELSAMWGVTERHR